jgi:hypothetical protein
MAPKSGLAVAKGNAIGDQGRKVGRAKADAWRGLAVVLDVRRFVQVVRKGLGQFGVLGMGLGVIPTNPVVSSKDGVTIVEDSPCFEIQCFYDTQHEAIVQRNAAFDDSCQCARAVQAQSGTCDFGIVIKQAIN